MYKQEADRLQLALDGIVANIETLREVISRSIDPEPPEQLADTIIDPTQPCTHPDIRQIDTMGGSKTYCFECGYAE